MDAGPWNDADALTRRAVQLIQQKRFAEALEDLELASSMDPFNAAPHFHRGVCLDELNRPFEAIDAYESALEVEPDDCETLNRLGVDLHQTGKTDRALRVLESIEKLDAAYEPAYCNRLHIHVSQGQYERAEEVFYLARLYKEHCPRCYYNMGIAMAVQDRHEQAARCFRRAIDLPGAGAEVHRRLAESLLALGEADSARLHLNHSLALDPNNIGTLLTLCDLLLEQRRHREADARIERLLRLAPEDASAQLLAGRLAFVRSQFVLAINRLERALELDPTLVRAHLTLAQALLKIGRPEPARLHLRAELMLQPHSVPMLLQLGNLLLDVRDLSAAASCFTRVLAIDARSVRAMQNLGVAECESGRLPAGIHAFRRALVLDPRSIDLHHNLAVALADAKRWDEAMQLLNDACAKMSDKSLHNLRLRLRLRRIREWGERMIIRLKKRRRR
jgi:protein O-GlcNAc transferase